MSRTFSEPVDNLEGLIEAISSYVARASEKLREDSLAACSMTVSANTNRFGDDMYYKALTVVFDVATSDTMELIRAASSCISKMYIKGKMFKKCGVVLYNLVSDRCIQGSLFNIKDIQKSKRLMQLVDDINKNHCQLKWASEGLEQDWKARFNHRSHRYTTRWDELPTVMM